MDLKEEATKKAGPLQVWQWAAVGGIGVAAIVIIRRFLSGQTGSASTVSLTPNPTATADTSAGGTGTGGTPNPPPPPTPNPPQTGAFLWGLIRDAQGNHQQAVGTDIAALQTQATNEGGTLLTTRQGGTTGPFTEADFAQYGWAQAVVPTVTASTFGLPNQPTYTPVVTPAGPAMDYPAMQPTESFQPFTPPPMTTGFDANYGQPNIYGLPTQNQEFPVASGPGPGILFLNGAWRKVAA